MDVDNGPIPGPSSQQSNPHNFNFNFGKTPVQVKNTPFEFRANPTLHPNPDEFNPLIIHRTRPIAYIEQTVHDVPGLYQVLKQKVVYEDDNGDHLILK